MTAVGSGELNSAPNRGRSGSGVGLRPRLGRGPGSASRRPRPRPPRPGLVGLRWPRVPRSRLVRRSRSAPGAPGGSSRCLGCSGSATRARLLCAPGRRSSRLAAAQERGLGGTGGRRGTALSPSRGSLGPVPRGGCRGGGRTAGGERGDGAEMVRKTRSIGCYQVAAVASRLAAVPQTTRAPAPPVRPARVPPGSGRGSHDQARADRRRPGVVEPALRLTPARGGNGGRRSATAARAANTSSGRTAA